MGNGHIPEQAVKWIMCMLVVAWVCAGSWAWGQATQAGEDYHQALDVILAATVRGDAVDYLTLREEHYQDLLAYLEKLGAVDPSALTREEKLAYYINLYNATVLRTVAERFKAGYSPAENEWSLFNDRLLLVSGKHVSLNQLEQLLAQDFKEPRIHLALVGAAKSAPLLLNRAYRGATLGQGLEDNLRVFTTDTRRNRVREEDKTLELSSIFQWYAEDFGGQDALAGYVGKIMGRDFAGYELEFKPFDWELNLAAPAAGPWVRLKENAALMIEPKAEAIGLGLGEQDQVFRVLEEENGYLLIHRPLDTQNAWVEKTITEPFTP
ncbi:MAG: DUF547 domain-containing protein [Phycisphaeraceae bacterium]|nr:DUF547 domain-containing protein [Phycisphaeraceae bacterium]